MMFAKSKTRSLVLFSALLLAVLVFVSFNSRAFGTRCGEIS
jgi:hypothetical protein